MNAPAKRIVQVLDGACAALVRIDEAESARSLAEGKWSARQVIGHLVDSASNNHERFVVAQGRSDLCFAGYEQEQWVERQRYQTTSWADLLELWTALNRHLVRIMDAADDHDLHRERHPHTLDTMAWRPVPADEPTSLGYLMADYVDHLEYHLRQILGDAWTGPGPAPEAQGSD